MRLSFEERFYYIHDALNEIPGVDCPECDGAFYAFPSFQGFIDRMENIRDDVELASWLLEAAGVATVPGSAFGAPGHLRLSFASSLDHLEEAISRIKTAARCRRSGFIREGIANVPCVRSRNPFLQKYPPNAYMPRHAQAANCALCVSRSRHRSKLPKRAFPFSN